MRRYVTAAVGSSLLLLVGVILLIRYCRTSSVTGERVYARPTTSAESRRISGNHWVVSKLDKDSYLQDLAGVTKQITLKPNAGKEVDSVTDLSILKVAEGSPMYVAGFRKHDRILKVNGTPIDTMSRAVNLIHEIKACSQLTVQVQRGGQIIDYQFDFR